MMVFPYGEWIILFLTLETWVEKRASRRFFLMLTMAWLIGKWLEFVFPATTPWQWNYARLSVMLVFWVWALQRAEERMIPLFFTSALVLMETLFQVNEPGIFPHGSWVFPLILTLAAWLTTKSFWGTAAALVGSLLLNQLFVRFTYDGIVRHAVLPNELVWNLGVAFLAIWAGLRYGFQSYAERKLEKSTADKLVTNSTGLASSQEERELQ